MPKETLQSTDIHWPKYFQPRSGQESPPTGELLRIPVTLVDVLYVRDRKSEPTELVVVVGCLGGDLDIVTGEAISALPDDLQKQIQTVQVSQRSRFRAITATELNFFTLDAVEQQVEAPGYNDAVYLYGKAHGQLSTKLGNVKATPLSNEGRITVGRLDLLNAYKTSLDHKFQNPDAPGETMYQFMVPMEGVGEVQKGKGIALVYPILDPGVYDRTDNSVIVMRISYDLLSKLQEDMREEGKNNSFTKMTIPVPSRSRLEAELAVDGYEVEGNIAIKKSDAHEKEAEGQTTFLTRLRHKTAHWSSPRIELPSQATPRDYQKIIKEAFSAVLSREDAKMMEALSQRVETQVSPEEKPSVVPTVSRTPQPKSPSVQPTRRRSAASARREGWREDFASPVKPPKEKRQTRDWGKDFDNSTSGRGVQSGLITSSSDWERDFQAQEELLKERRGWKQDFSTEEPDKSESKPARNWGGDFEN